MGDVLVLCYHGISETWPAATSVRPGDFEGQLHGARAPRLPRRDHLAQALTAPPAERTLAVTFDDAHRSVLELAAPIMARLGMPGTVFVPTDYAGTEPADGLGRLRRLARHRARATSCSASAGRSCAASPPRGWEVGSHTCSHPRLSRLDDAAIAAELSESKRVCEERIGAPCDSLAYPYSDYDERAVRAPLARRATASPSTVPRRPGVAAAAGVAAGRRLPRRERPPGAAAGPARGGCAPPAAMRAALALRRLAR